MADRSGVESLLVALDVPRHARNGFGVGLLLAAAAFAVFVLGTGQTRAPGPFYVLLGFVLAFTTGLVVTTVLVAVEAYRLAG